MQSQSVRGICPLKCTVVEGSNCILYIGLFLWQEHQFSLKMTNSTYTESQMVFLCFSAVDSSLLNQKSPYYRKKHAYTQSPWAERTVTNGQILQKLHQITFTCNSHWQYNETSRQQYIFKCRNGYFFFNLLC